MAGPLWCCVGPLLPPDGILSATGAAGTSYKRHWLLLPGLMDLSSLDLSIFFPPRKQGWGVCLPKTECQFNTLFQVDSCF